MSFKINTVRNKRNSVKPLTETESLAENIDEKSVKIQNNGNDYFINFLKIKLNRQELYQTLRQFLMKNKINGYL